MRVILIALVLFANIGNAHSKGSQKLIEDCKLAQLLIRGKGTSLSSEQQISAVYCLAFADGFYASTFFWKDKPFCLPSDITAQKLVDAYVAWSKKNQNRIIFPQQVTFYSATKETFKCQ